MQDPSSESIEIPKKRSWRRIVAYSALSCFGVLVIYVLVDLLEPQRRLVTISKETTYITEPLKPNGYPNYIDAINRIQSAGVNRQNNAYIPILETVGPREIGQEMEVEYFIWLGIPKLPRDGDYLQTYEDYVQKIPDDKLPLISVEEFNRIRKERGSLPGEGEISPDDEAKDRIKITREFLENDGDLYYRPWNEKDHPVVAEWLKKQEPILERLEGIEKRTRFYAPILASKENEQAMTAQLPHANPARQLSYVLLARAYFAIGSGRANDAIPDIKKSFHIGERLYEGITLVDQLVGLAIESMAADCMNRIVQDPNVSQQAKDDLEQFYRALKPMNVTRAFDVGERFMYLNAVTRAAEVGIQNTFSGMMPRRKKKAGSSKYIYEDSSESNSGDAFYFRKKLDYDLILRDANALYDQILKLRANPDLQKQFDELEQIAVDAKREATGDANDIVLMQRIGSLITTKKSRSEKASKILKALMTPAVSAIIKAERKQQMRREMNLAGFALAKYYKKHGKYPVDFAELKSEGIAKVPDDVYSGKPCIYVCDGVGFVLYSVGQDGIDAGGYDSSNETSLTSSNQSCDDIAIFSLDRVPQPPKVADPAAPSDAEP